MRRALLAVCLTAGAGLAVAGAVPGGAAPAPGTPPVTFGVPRIVDPIHSYGEPDIKVAPDGEIYVSGPAGTGVQRSIWNASVDGGNSFRLVKAAPSGVPESVLDPSGLVPTKSTLGPGGGDTDIAIARNGTTYFTDLYGLACFTAGVTHNGGASVDSSPLGCSHPPGDRQWLGLYDPAPADHSISAYRGPTPLAYLSYNSVINGDNVDMSTNGIEYTTNAGSFGTDGVHSGTDANIAVDQHTGDVLAVTATGSNAGAFGLALGVGVPSSTGQLSFHYDQAATGLAGSPGVLFPTITEDTHRDLYIVWIDSATYQTYYTWAPPDAAGTDWTRWAPPVQLSHAPSGTSVFSWAQAGGPGLLDVAWYGTRATPSQLGPNGPSAQDGQAWNVIFDQVDHANSPHPHAVEVVATPHPMHYGDICLLGTGCITAEGNRNLADFFELAIDGAGRARIVYDDTSNNLLQAGLGATNGSLDHSGADVVSVLTQSTGLSAWTGKPLAPRAGTAPVAGITQRPGGALFPPLGGTAVPAADVTTVHLARTGATLTITVHTAGGPLSQVAQAVREPFATLVVRWQLGNTLYHAAVQSDAAGALVRYYAGRTQTTDLCSVSACDPHVFDYVGPPSPNAVSVPGKVATSAGGTTYTLAVPLSVMGRPGPGSLLEEVTAFVTSNARPDLVPVSTAEAFLDEVPVELDATRSFNFRLGR
ncbi:MAG: hypothetical protein ACYDB7_06455 [Mycobacteriales bacterium]